MSGIFPGMSGIFPGNFLEMYRKFPGNFQEISRNFPGNVRENSGHFQDISRKFPGNQLKIARFCRCRTVRITPACVSRRFPGGSREFPGVTRDHQNHHNPYLIFLGFFPGDLPSFWNISGNFPGHFLDAFRNFAGHIPSLVWNISGNFLDLFPETQRHKGGY